MDEKAENLEKSQNSEYETRKIKKGFDFELLPVELKHEVLQKLNTVFLDEVCAFVSPEWQGMVTDIIDQRVSKRMETIPAFMLKEVNSSVLPSVQNNPVEVLKMLERSTLHENVDITPILVNRNGVQRGLVSKLWNIRDCNCSKLDACLINSVHVMSALDLFIVQSTSGLYFFHLTDIERLESDQVDHDIKPYRCDWREGTDITSDTWLQHGSLSDISVFKDKIIVEEGPREVLLMIVSSCNHEEQSVELQGLRSIYLPIWIRALCLLEDKFYVLYSTGYVGMWDQKADKVSMSPNTCRRSREDYGGMHLAKLYRVGELVFITTMSTNPQFWNVLDSTDDKMEVTIVRMEELITESFLKEKPSWECIEVLYIGLWYNSFIVHCRIQSLVSGETENRLMLKRIQRPPTVADFCWRGGTCPEFLANDFEVKSLQVNGYVMGPFFPLNLKLNPWMLEPKVHTPIPVADMIALYWPLQPRGRRRKVKVYRIRISNLPKSFQEQ